MQVSQGQGARPQVLGRPKAGGVACRAWKTTWRTQTGEPDATEQHSSNNNGGPRRVAGGQTSAPFASPLFSEDFVNSLRESLKRTPTVAEAAVLTSESRSLQQPTAAAPARAFNRNGSSNGNGSHAPAAALSNWRTAAEEPQANGWSNSRQEEAERETTDASGTIGRNGLFTDRFREVLKESAQLGPDGGVNGHAPSAPQEDAAGEELDGGAAPLFNDSFKAALQEALSRSPLYTTPLLDEALAGTPEVYEQDATPQPTNIGQAVEAVGNPLFSDGFKSVLSSALNRTQEQADTMMAFGSDDDDVGVPPVRAAPPRPRCVAGMYVCKAGRRG